MQAQVPVRDRTLATLGTVLKGFNDRYYDLAQHKKSLVDTLNERFSETGGFVKEHPDRSEEVFERFYGLALGVSALMVREPANLAMADE